ncbi:hypothetical protein [Rhizobium halophytocola]|uniref:Uncharacterized protein n=1 Tax=Rhizobium halophytocola TaxID=735519 RepID=A0ABS4E1A0_9HYPH|nr:hypothetical protein [Rhizobium halophytocola]MBP1851715.1 hypothetical protein [Rhizobium halophytocola]
MNRIVREHYPVDRLPADLREGLAEHATVRIEIEVEAATKEAPEKLLTVQDTLEMIRKYRAEHPERVTAEESVARIRELRDEWD